MVVCLQISRQLQPRQERGMPSNGLLCPECFLFGRIVVLWWDFSGEMSEISVGTCAYGSRKRCAKDEPVLVHVRPLGTASSSRPPLIQRARSFSAGFLEINVFGSRRNASYPSLLPPGNDGPIP